MQELALEVHHEAANRNYRTAEALLRALCFGSAGGRAVQRTLSALPQAAQCRLVSRCAAPPRLRHAPATPVDTGKQIDAQTILSAAMGTFDGVAALPMQLLFGAADWREMDDLLLAFACCVGPMDLQSMRVAAPELLHDLAQHGAKHIDKAHAAGQTRGEALNAGDVQQMAVQALQWLAAWDAAGAARRLQMLQDGCKHAKLSLTLQDTGLHGSDAAVSGQGSELDRHALTGS